jgi:hypothetical protein
MPLDPERVVEGMRRYQRLLRDLLEASDWRTEDKNGNSLQRPFLKQSGWRKIARSFNPSFERVDSRVEREEDGTPVRAEVWIKETAPAGKEEDHARALAAGALASDELARVAFAALAQLLGRGEPDPAAARRVGERIAADHGYLPVAVGRALCYAATALGAGPPSREPSRPAPTAVAPEAPSAAPLPVETAPARGLAHWRNKGRYGDETVRSLAALACGESRPEALTAQQLGELAFLLECAARGRVTGRSLDSWLAQLAHRDDRRTAAEALGASWRRRTRWSWAAGARQRDEVDPTRDPHQEQCSQLMRVARSESGCTASWFGWSTQLDVASTRSRLPPSTGTMLAVQRVVQPRCVMARYYL